MDSRRHQARRHWAFLAGELQSCTQVLLYAKNVSIREDKRSEYELTESDESVLHFACGLDFRCRAWPCFPSLQLTVAFKVGVLLGL